MVEHQLPKLGIRVRFPYPAPLVWGYLAGVMLCAQGCAFSSVPIQKVFKPAGLYHEVQKGETLWSIAARYRLEVGAIREANRLPDPSKLSVGQLLYIPPQKPKDHSTVQSPQ